MTEGHCAAAVAIAIEFCIPCTSQPSTFNNPNEHMKGRRSCKCGSRGGVMKPSGPAGVRVPIDDKSKQAQSYRKGTHDRARAHTLAAVYFCLTIRLKFNLLEVEGRQRSEDPVGFSR